MVKKTDKSSGLRRELPNLLDNQLAQLVKESAQQIWLAGMGAFAKAQEGRNKVFEALIKEGTSLQRKTQSAAEEKIGEVTDRMSAMAGDVTSKAGQHWDKLESIFEQRTAKAMNKLGVPTAKDVDALIERVDQLAAAVARLSKQAPVKTAAKAAAKAPAKTAAAKKSTPSTRRAAARKGGA
ncbi:MAG TPA: phasin family protein [Rubrivivax sp.]|nr:phasin family protein [Rubrivivax sp.]